MRKRILGICACLLIFALDIVAAVLAIKAKEAQSHAKHVRVWLFECKGRSKQAFVLGVSAAVFHGVAHVFANLLGFCINTSSSSSHHSSPPTSCFSKLFFVLTWIIFLGGVTMLVMGTRSNEEKGISCGLTITYHDFLFTGAILCLIHAILSLAYYVTS